MTMKTKLAVLVCSMPFVAMPVAFAQTGGTTEGTTSPQSGTQTDLGAKGAPNQGGAKGAGNNTSAGGASSGAGSSTSGTSGATGGDGAKGSSSSSGGAKGGSSSSGSGATGSGTTGSGSHSSGATSGTSGGSHSSGATGGASGSSHSSGATGGTSGSSSSGASSMGGASSSSSATKSATSTADPAAGDSFQNKLRGKAVVNENDEKIGDVKDVVMSPDGKVTHVILGVGGFIGVGEHTVAIPYDKIQTSGDQLVLRGYTKDQLKDMPAYEYPREDRADRAPSSSGGSDTRAAPMGAPR